MSLGLLTIGMEVAVNWYKDMHDKKRQTGVQPLPHGNGSQRNSPRPSLARGLEG